MKASGLGSLAKDFLRPTDIGRSRSSILNPLQWALPILIAGMVVCAFGHPPTWLLIYFAILLALDFGALLGAFFYLLFTKPHLLRSEAHDYRVTELTLNRETAKLIERRDIEIKKGLFDEIADANRLKGEIVAVQQGKKDQ